MQVTGAPAFNVLFGQKSGAGYKVSGSAEELTVEMGNVVKKVTDQTPYRFFWLNIFLTTHMTVASNHISITIQADFLVTFFTM